MCLGLSGVALASSVTHALIVSCISGAAKHGWPIVTSCGRNYASRLSLSGSTHVSCSIGACTGDARVQEGQRLCLCVHERAARTGELVVVVGGSLFDSCGARHSHCSNRTRGFGGVCPERFPDCDFVQSFMLLAFALPSGDLDTQCCASSWASPRALARWCLWGYPLCALEVVGLGCLDLFCVPCVNGDALV